MSISRAHNGSARNAIQSALCGLGFHSFEEVGTKTETGHRYSEAHDTMYEVRQTWALVRCAHCRREAMKSEAVDEIEVGHYERVFVRNQPS
jgi:hypothetical protein